jgi:CHAT domain
MSVNLYEQRVKSLQRELDKQRKKQADEEGKAAKADQAAMRYASEAARARTESTLGAKLRQAESKRKEANRAAQTAAKASEAFAKASSDMADAQRKLAAAQANERKKELDKRSREQQRADRQQRDRNRQRDRELEQLRAHAGALESRIDRATAAPDKVTVLFIAASPEDQPPLRLDREVREIQRRFRETEHRDSVEFEWRVATHLGDLLQALNETKPHIVHFSGHGSQDELAFEDDDGRTKSLPNDMLANLLRSSSDRIRLAVFNSCYSGAQAAIACEYIDAAVGMDLPVDDEAAKIFAGQFYNSLGFAVSVQQAFEQVVFRFKRSLAVCLARPNCTARMTSNPVT